MPHPKIDATTLLGSAIRAKEPARRLEYAESALQVEELTAEMRMLLLRQAYLAFMELGRFEQAAKTAQKMCQLRPEDSALLDIAFHDAARAHHALGNRAQAISFLRLAVRHAPPDRRSFQMWSLATAQHFAGHVDDALQTLKKALLHSARDRALIRGHRAFIRLEAGRPVRRLADVQRSLGASKAREGYGRFVLGMIAHHLGDHATARVHLRAFLHRNASADRAKVVTLSDEIARARSVLASSLD